MAQSGNLFIVSGPSGAGKSVLVTSVLRSLPALKFSVSYTTRAPRGTERDGIEYYFVDQARFDGLIRKGELLEWAQVYGQFYGTSRKVVDEALQAGNDLVLDVDVQGARSIRTKRPEAISVFIMPPSYPVLRERLEQRKLDKDYVIEQRLRIACEEINHYKDYDYLIINEDLGRSSEELKAIIIASRCGSRARAENAQAIVVTFGGLDAKNT